MLKILIVDDDQLVRYEQYLFKIRHPLELSNKCHELSAHLQLLIFCFYCDLSFSFLYTTSIATDLWVAL